MPSIYTSKLVIKIAQNTLQRAQLEEYYSVLLSEKLETKGFPINLKSKSKLVGNSGREEDFLFPTVPVSSKITG